jgi:hypothetical protein
MKPSFVSIVLILLTGSIAQTTPQITQDSALQRARKGDDSALAQMEQAGDLHDLKVLMSDPTYAGKSAVRLSLARMGDTTALQYFACRSLTDDVDKTQLLLRDEYDHIGGAFTVQIYRQLLDSDARYLGFVKRNRQHRYSDVVVKLPSSMVLPYLSKLLPTANIPTPPFGDWPGEETNLKERWRKWIDEHKNDIQVMRPSPAGVNFSSSFCAGFNKKAPSSK